MKNTFPIMYVLMSSKDYYLYLNLFRKNKTIIRRYENENRFQKYFLYDGL